MQKINTCVLVSGADYFDDGFAINAYMDDSVPVDVEKAKQEHAAIVQCFKDAGIEVIQVPPPENCQDAAYTANWGLVRGEKVIMSSLPNKRKAEESYAENVLRQHGKQIIKLPEDIPFSGQGDAVPCGNYVFVGSQYRTGLEAHPLIARDLGFEVIGLQTIPQYDDNQQPVINPVTGWPDSFFYDIDLAIAIIKGPSEQNNGLIAWCPEAFMPESQERIRAIKDIDKIEVSLEEAMHGFACNLVSTGETVIMSNKAPQLQKTLEDMGLKTLTPEVTELLKGGGFIRCISLSL